MVPVAGFCRRRWLLLPPPPLCYPRRSFTGAACVNFTGCILELLSCRAVGALLGSRVISGSLERLGCLATGGPPDRLGCRSDKSTRENAAKPSGRRGAFELLGRLRSGGEARLPVPNYQLLRGPSGCWITGLLDCWTSLLGDWSDQTIAEEATHRVGRPSASFLRSNATPCCCGLCWVLLSALGCSGASAGVATAAVCRLKPWEPRRVLGGIMPRRSLPELAVPSRPTETFCGLSELLEIWWPQTEATSNRNGPWLHIPVPVEPFPSQSHWSHLRQAWHEHIWGAWKDCRTLALTEHLGPIKPNWG